MTVVRQQKYELTQTMQVETDSATAITEESQPLTGNPKYNSLSEQLVPIADCTFGLGNGHRS